MVAHLLHQGSDWYGIPVGHLVHLALDPGPVDQLPGICDEARGREPDVVVDLVHLLNRVDDDQLAGDPLVYDEDHAILVLQTDSCGPPLHRFPGIFDLVQSSVGREGRNAVIISSSTGLH